MTRFVKVVKATNHSTIADLVDMLTYARPHGSIAEQAFVERFVMPLGVKFDKFGNGILQIGSSPILWSCHTDSVHMKQGRQEIAYRNGLIQLGKTAPNHAVLGGDDAAGVWLMAEMIRANVPGLYIFHAGEEIGGVGSMWIAENSAKELADVKFAIALDRKGTNSVITHQGGRTCSDQFAADLATLLGNGFKPDSTGLFTDTANYAHLIPECTNLSVGYEHAHSAKETLDPRFLVKLRDVLIKTDFTPLTAHRDPKEPDRARFDDNLDGYYGLGYLHHTPDIIHDSRHIVDITLENLVRDYPDVAADMLEECGVDAVELRDRIEKAGYITD